SPIPTLSSQPVENQTFLRLAVTSAVIGGRTAWMAEPGHDGDCGLRKTARAPWTMATGATFRARMAWRQSSHRATFLLRTNVAQFSTFAKDFHAAHGGRPSAGTPRTGRLWRRKRRGAGRAPPRRRCNADGGGKPSPAKASGRKAGNSNARNSENLRKNREILRGSREVCSGAFR